MFERHIGREFNEQKDVELFDEFIMELSQPKPVIPKTPSRSTERPKSKAGKSTVTDEPPMYSLTAVVPEGNVLAEATGDLYIFDAAEGGFLPQAENILIQLVQSDGDKYVFYFGITDNDGKATPRLSQRLSAAVNPQFRKENNSFIWVWLDDARNIPMFSFSVKFTKNAEYDNFLGIFGKCMYEIQFRESFDKIKDSDRDFLIDAYVEDLSMDEADDDSDVDDNASDGGLHEDVQESRPSKKALDAGILPLPP